MNEFGDFASIDVDKLLNGAKERQAKLAEMQERIAALVGRARDDEGLVTVTYTSSGLDELVIDPRAMRKGSRELAATVKDQIRAATADLQRQITEVTTEALGVEPTGLDRDTALAKAEEAKAVFDRTLKDAVTQLDTVRNRLGL